MKDILGKKVVVTVDRKMGTYHPEHKDILYEVNYGYVENVLAGDGEEQDAYILGIDHPVERFEGIVTAIIHRINDNEDKWVVIPVNAVVSDEEILRKTNFQEKFFKIRLIR
ncbi:MAG: inorganic pyrophosphatase [Clostridia bacterium]|nr:inorganic pyrophosphatase [Clostridia bacterium]